MAGFKTEEGRRPDLEAMPVNEPEGYIGKFIYPTLPTREKTGSIYYKTVTADKTAQTGRVAGVAPTATLLNDSVTTFSVAEVIERYGVVKAEVKQMGGIENADSLGGQASKRSVQNAQEQLHATQFFTGSKTDISAAILNGIQTGLQSIKRYKGKSAFVTSASTYLWIIRQTEVTDKLQWTFNPQNTDPNDILSVKTQAFKALLQTVYGVDEVLIGDDDQWDDTTGWAGVVKLPDPAEFSHKMNAVLGKTALYLPDGDQQFEIESFYNEDTKTNMYDATAWQAIKELNSGAKALFSGLVTGS